MDYYNQMAEAMEAEIADFTNAGFCRSSAIAELIPSMESLRVYCANRNDHQAAERYRHALDYLRKERLAALCTS